MKTLALLAAFVVVGMSLGCSREAQPPSHANVIRDALIRLLKRPAGAILIIEGRRSKKFLQFAGSRDEPLLLDLPAEPLSAEEMQKAKALFAELGYPGPETYQVLESPGGPPAGKQTSFHVKFGTDVDKATELAVAVLHRVYGFGEDVDLKLTEE